MPTETMDVLRRARVCGRQLEIARFTGELPVRNERRGRPFGDRGNDRGGERRGGRGEGRDRPFGGDRGDFKRNGPRKPATGKFDKGGRRDR